MADVQAVIVGAGAGGGVAAYVLASRGWKVALLEKGRNPYPSLAAPVLRGSLFGNDELRGRRFYAYQDPLIEPRTFRATDADPAGPMGEMQGLGVCVGGGTVQYDGDSPRVTQADLEFLSRWGAVTGAEMVDWPITYDELAPYYDATEAAIGIQGLAGANPFEDPRHPYPMPPGYEPKGATVLKRGADRLGLHAHPMPMAVNSIFYRGRPACVNCGFCAFGCPVNAKGSTAVTVVRDAVLTGNLTLLTECCAIRVETDATGRRATGVRYIDGAGAQQVITADHVIIAGNAIETPRLLLLSANDAHPDGLGNSSGLVGRCLMFHIVFSAIGTFDEEIRTYRGRVVTHALADFTQPDGTVDWIRGGYTELGGSIHPVEEGIRYPWVLHKPLMVDGSFLKRISNVTMIGEDVPVASNRVDLDPTVRDVYGQPVARVTYARHPRDQELVNRYLPKLVEIARASGATSVMTYDFHREEGIPDTKHLLGTTRMGSDPATSVTNAWGRLHDVDNVWIADGALYATGTGFNPTLTQQALAWRTAAYLVNPGEPTP
jgi:choline dehydrogenase-like flavoprotein